MQHRVVGHFSVKEGGKLSPQAARKVCRALFRGQTNATLEICSVLDTKKRIFTLVACNTTTCGM